MSNDFDVKKLPAHFEVVAVDADTGAGYVPITYVVELQARVGELELLLAKMKARMVALGVQPE